MLDYLISLDRSLFLALNGAHAPWLDPVMVFASHKLTWIPFYALLVLLVYRAGGWRRTLLFLLGVGLVVLLADQGSVHLFKNTVMRLRPSHAEGLQDIVHLPTGHRGGAFGFVSSHAANCFGVAMFTVLSMRRRVFALLLWPWALLVGYSRVYMGVHYPGDVLCGALFGLCVGLLVGRLVPWVWRRAAGTPWHGAKGRAG